MYFFELLEGEFLNTETIVDLSSDEGENPVGNTNVVDLSSNLSNPIFGASISGFHDDLMDAVGKGVSPAAVEIKYANLIVGS